jgi:hypothetical protein
VGGEIGEDGTDRAPPPRRPGGCESGLGDGFPDVIVTGGQFADTFGRAGVAAGSRQVANFFLCAGVGLEQPGQALPDIPREPARVVTNRGANRVFQCLG